MTKLRAYESKTLADNYTILAQIVAKLHLAMKEAEVSDLKSLPPSVVSTEILYNIAICYSVMYDTLVENQLLHAGHNHKSKLTH